MFRPAKELAGQHSGLDPYLIGRNALHPAVTLALRYAQQQGLLSRVLASGEAWERTSLL